MVKINGDFITLGQFLKFQKIVLSGGAVRSFLKDHKIVINHEIESRRGRKIYKGDIVEIATEKYQIG